MLNDDEKQVLQKLLVILNWPFVRDQKTNEMEVEDEKKLKEQLDVLKDLLKKAGLNDLAGQADVVEKLVEQQKTSEAFSSLQRILEEARKKV